MGKEWSVPAQWPDETVFIIAGGPSVKTQPIARLKGRKVIVVNSSYQVFPEADYLYTMDCRWLKYHQEIIRGSFKGKVVTNSQDARRLPWPELLCLRKVPPPGLATDTRYVSGLRTSLHGAINLACHLTGWTGRIVLLGADGGRDKSGTSHHHTPHPWKSKIGCWDEQLLDLKTTIPVTKKHRIEVLNASPNTHWPIWPITDLETIFALERPAPAVIVCADIKKTMEFVLKDCSVPFRLEKFYAVTSKEDLKGLLPYLGRGVIWHSIGYNQPDVVEKVRNMFGSDKPRDEFIRLVQK